MPSQVFDAQRAFFKSTIKSNLINGLYKAPIKELEQELISLAQENLSLNCILKKKDTPYYFYYRGHKHYNSNYNELKDHDVLLYRNQTQVDLHENLRPKMHKIYEFTEDIELEAKIIEAFLNKLLNNTENPNDLYCILPKAIHEFITYKGNTPSVLLPEECEQIRTYHAKYIDVLNQRVLTNLLIRE